MIFAGGAMNKRTIYLCVIIIVVIITSSCSLLQNSTGQPGDENTINTSVSLTGAANLPAAATDQPVDAVVTPSVQAPQITPSFTPSITAKPLSTVNIPDTATPTEDTCNRASWVEDVTIPDGSIFVPNTAFTKTWRIKNVGSCTWNTNYAIVYYSGDQMSAPSATNLSANLAPGQVMDISVNMKSPAVDGKYKGNFMFRSDKGLIFGTGSTYSYPVYAEIEVSQAQVIPNLNFDGLVFVIPLEFLVNDMATNYCSAKWYNNNGTVLACPGTTSDNIGFVVRNDSPKLQDNQTHEGVALFTHPMWQDGGGIAGDYPLMTIENGMKFRATIGCGLGGSACDVVFKLNYRDEGGTFHSLKSWSMKYSDAPIDVEYDLSALAGVKVKLMLQVVTNGSSAQDWAHWVYPRIIK